jgi:hypothetical protein
VFRASRLLSESNPRSEPTCERLLVKLARRDIKHGLDGVIHIGWVRIPRSTVEIDEQQQARPGRALVAIGQRMIPRKATPEYGRLVVQVGVEVLFAVPGLRRVQRRICQLDPACLDQCRGVETGDLLGQPEELGEVEVPGHSARRSMIAWSRSRSRRARLMKSASDRKRSISVDNESMINWFTLVDRAA